MMAAKTVVELIREVLKKDPRAAIVLGEILGPPPALEKSPPRPWEDQS